MISVYQALETTIAVFAHRLRIGPERHGYTYSLLTPYTWLPRPPRRYGDTKPPPSIAPDSEVSGALPEGTPGGQEPQERGVPKSLRRHASLHENPPALTGRDVGILVEARPCLGAGEEAP